MLQDTCVHRQGQAEARRAYTWNKTSRKQTSYCASVETTQSGLDLSTCDIPAICSREEEGRTEKCWS